MTTTPRSAKIAAARHTAVSIAWTLAFVCAAGGLRAAETPLYERPPTDLLRLSKGSKSVELEVLPLANRNPAGVKPSSGELVVRPVDNPSSELAIPAGTVQGVVLFEQRLLDAAKRYAAEGDFDEAYAYFARIDRDYPDLLGYRDAFTEAIYDEARARFRDGEHEHALALLQTLNERAAGGDGLQRAVETIGDAILRQRWDAGDYIGVRRVVDTIEGQFAGLRLELGDRWIGRIAEGAGRERDRAAKLAAAGRLREALRVASGAAALDPDSPETAQLLERLGSAEKTLWVGVWEAPSADTPPNLDRPAATRQSRLTAGRLATLDAYEATGGRYGSPFGVWEVDDGRRVLSLRPGPTAPPDTAYRLARALLEPASGGFDPLSALRERATSVSVVGADTVRIELAGAHPQPEALAVCAAPASMAGSPADAWMRTASPPGDAAARYERRSSGGEFEAVEEYVYQDVDAAIEALRTRQVHVLAGVPPWKLGIVKAIPGVAVQAYRVPTLHCLLLHPDTPLRERREVRRALCYALARKETLDQLVLGGDARAGFELLSAPVPRGKSLGDPLRYAYNDSVEPRPYEPRLAALLLAAARADAEEDPSGPKAPKSVTLAYAPKPLVRLACEAIRSQLGAIGLEVTLLEASEGDLAAGRVAYDLRYAELCVTEPLVDVWRVLGPGGVSGGCSPAMRDGLDDVLRAGTGKAAAAALRDLHRIAYADVPLVPLWQTIDYFAYMNNLRGVGDEPVDLYQSIDAWRVTGGGRR